MPTVDRDELPYPVQPAVLTPGGPKPLPPEVIDAATGQCLDPSVKEAEGILRFHDAGVGFQPDVALPADSYVWEYGDIESYSIEGGLLILLVRFLKRMELRTLTLRIEGRRFRFRIGSMLAANADYILTAYGVPSR